MKLYAKTCINISRAQKVTQRTLPSVWTWKYFKMLIGALKIGMQFANAHNHHTARELKRAMYKGKEVPGLSFKPRSNELIGIKSKPVVVNHQLIVES
jgi:hypothetical protein